MVEEIATNVVPWLLEEIHFSKVIFPVLLHGNLQEENICLGRIGATGESEMIVFNPSVFYGHSEYDVAMIRSNNLPREFWTEYYGILAQQGLKNQCSERQLLYGL